MASQSQQVKPRGWRFPFAFFGGPILWGLQLLAGYGLATVSCDIHNKLPVYLLIGASAVITLAAAFVAVNAWHDWPGKEHSIFMEANQEDENSTFLAVSGFVVSLLFFLMILATLISDIFLSPCPIITMPLP